MARDVRGVRRARLAGRAERALGDPPVGRPREDRSPALELVDVVRRLVAEDLDRVLVAEVVGALHRVERVLLRIVLGGVAERRVDAAFGRARVASHRVDLRHHRDVRARVEGLDRRAHPGAAGADDHDVVDRVHREGRYLIALAASTVERTSRERSSPRSSAPCTRPSRPCRPRPRSGASSPSPAAVSRTGRYDGNVAEHLGRHAIPTASSAPTPRPVTATVSRNAAGAKSAETRRARPRRSPSTLRSRCTRRPSARAWRPHPASP